MSLDQCIFCTHAIDMSDSSSLRLDCGKIDAGLSEDVFTHLWFSFNGLAECLYHEHLGTGYAHFFRYIYIALKRGRDTA